MVHRFLKDPRRNKKFSPKPQNQRTVPVKQHHEDEGYFHDSKMLISQLHEGSASSEPGICHILNTLAPGAKSVLKKKTSKHNIFLRQRALLSF